MEIFHGDVLLFLVFFIPGFISIKIYDLIVPTIHREISRYWMDAVVYSTINFVLLSSLIWWMHFSASYDEHPIKYFLSLVFILLIMPVILPITWLQLLRSRWIKKYINDPMKRPWDWFFHKNKEVFWVIVKMRDNTRIGGLFAGKSMACRYPMEESIYLEQVWQLDEQGKFIEPIPESKGVIILNKDISVVEFVEVLEE